MATYLIDGATPLPENGDTGWGSTLNTAIQAIDDRFTYSSPSYSLASTVLGSSLTSVGTLTSLTVSGAGSIGGNLTVTGNLTVNGTTTTTNSTIVTVDDPIFTLGGDSAPGSDDNKDRGIEFRWHDGSTAKVGFFGFDDSTGKFTFVPDATNSSEVFSGTIGEIDAQIDWSNVLNKPDPEITVTLTGDVAGSASATLTDLANGTITVSTTVQSDSVALGTDTTGDYVESLVAGTGVTLSNNSGEGATPTVEIGQAVGTGASVTFASVNAPVTGNVTGDLTGNVTGDVTGNASTASALQTARTINLGGDLSGSASFDGTSDITISATVSLDSVTLGDDTTGDYVESLTAGTGVILGGTIGEGSIPTIAIGQAVGTTDDVTFNSVTASLSGNVTGDVTGSVTGDIYAGNGTSKVLDNGTDGTDATFTGTVSSIANHALGDLSDTNFTIVTPASGDHLYFDGADWINRPINLDTLSDVSMGFFPPAAGDFLVYDGSNFSPSPLSTYEGDTADVNLTAAGSNTSASITDGSPIQDANGSAASVTVTVTSGFTKNIVELGGVFQSVTATDEEPYLLLQRSTNGGSSWTDVQSVQVGATEENSGGTLQQQYAPIFVRVVDTHGASSGTSVMYRFVNNTAAVLGGSANTMNQFFANTAASFSAKEAR